MNRSFGFWIAMAIFQVLFGLAVFAITRDYYRADPGSEMAKPTVAQLPPMEPRAPFADINPALLGSLSTDASGTQNPVEISQQANQLFAERQYAAAAAAYEKLLAFDPGNVDTLNNLGLTLHYVGRSDEALKRLNEGVALDPTYQRIWLTLGYVNSSVGNVEPARAALTTAVEMDPDSGVGRSAKQMLDGLK